MGESSQQLNHNQKKPSIFVALGFSLFCFLTLGVVYSYGRRAFTDIIKLNPQDGRILANQITDYDVPAGYTELGGVSILGIVMANIVEEENHKNAIWLVQAPNDNLPSPENFLRDMNAYPRNNAITWTTEDSKTYRVRDELREIRTYTGITQDNQNYRAWVGRFTGKGGPAFIVIVAQTEDWNDNLAESFINSMR